MKYYKNKINISYIFLYINYIYNINIFIEIYMTMNI